MALFSAIGALAGAGLAATGVVSAGVGTAAMIGGGIGLKAAGAYKQSQARKDQAEYNRDVALTNKQIAEDNARDVELRGRQAVYDQRRAVARELGDVRAATAASGLVVGEAGTTPQDMVQAMTEAGELDVMRLRNNIEREKRRAIVQATSYEAQAGQFDLQRQSESPFRSALTSIAGSASSGATRDILFG